MKEKIIQLFNKRANGAGKIIFSPELKVDRTKDVLYISQIYERSFVQSSKSYFVILEVGCSNEHTIVPLGLLDTFTLEAIYLRLICKNETVLAVEKK